MATKKEEEKTGYQSKYREQMDSLADQILNRKPFSHNLNGEAFYNQYKDKFTRQGELARMDTEGQLQGLTGGHKNSYARQAGQQAYQEQEQNMGAVIPELYQLAMDSYNRKGAALVGQYNQLAKLEEKDREEHLNQQEKGDDAPAEVPAPQATPATYDNAVRQMVANKGGYSAVVNNVPTSNTAGAHPLMQTKPSEPTLDQDSVKTSISTYADAVQELRTNGVRSNVMQNLMTREQWETAVAEANTAMETGEGTVNLAVVGYDNYVEYLRAYVAGALSVKKGRNNGSQITTSVGAISSTQ